MTVLEAAVSRAAGRVEITYFPGYLIFSGVNVHQDDVRAGVRRDVEKLAARLEPTERDMLLEVAPLLVEERIVGEQRQCRSFTIHSILADYDFVDLIKIDIEHREVQILESLGPDEWMRIGVICLEPDMYPADMAAARSILSRNGFDVVCYPVASSDDVPAFIAVGPRT